jgi:hypothetical protein
VKKLFEYLIILFMAFSIVHPAVVSADTKPDVYLNLGLFSKIDPSSDFDGGNDFFYNDCASSLEIPLWDNSKLEGMPRAYKTIESSPGWLEGRKYDKKSNKDFKYESDDFTINSEFSPAALKRKWYTNNILDEQSVSERQTDALQRKTESWPIRALVIGKKMNVGDGGIEISIKTLTFDEKGNVVDESHPKVKKRVGFACSSLFLINKNTLESSIAIERAAFSYYAPEQRMCHFFPNATFGTWWVTAGTLEDHRKMLLSRCKSPFWIPLKPDGSNQAEVEEYEKSADQKHLQSFIPSELDLSKPIESNNFILTVRFSDPVKPVYHASLPNQCLVDCPNTGAKQIEGLELKLKPIESKKSRKK